MFAVEESITVLAYITRVSTSFATLLIKLCISSVSAHELPKEGIQSEIYIPERRNRLEMGLFYHHLKEWSPQTLEGHLVGAR